MTALCALQNDSRHTSITVANSKIDIALPEGNFSHISREDLLHWVNTAANTVSRYYGHFPVPHLSLRIRADDNADVHHGTTWPTNGGLIVISVGRDITKDDLFKDWMLTHEMIHLAFPSMEDEHHWIEEGISTYVEPVARAAAGGLTAQDIWKEFIRDMPQGQPEAGDQGFDVTHTWGRTYWGGAMFCLVADVQIHEQTQNQKGLRDALRAINNHGGNITQDWTIEKALATGDAATGTHVLQNLYREWGTHAVTFDLDALWRKLGVSLQNGNVVFDDHAPDAEIRKAITR